MVKYFCDRCGNEVKPSCLTIPVYARDGLGIKIVFVCCKHLCDECAKKFNMVKDRLEYEEDFFGMSDNDISLMEYDFKVGDEVITSTGQVGIIESICGCEGCKKRGFYEPRVKTTDGVYDIYITNNDKNNCFTSFYKIGKYNFGNIDKESVGREIEYETDSIKESIERLEEFNKQLNLLSKLESADKTGRNAVFDTK